MPDGFEKKEADWNSALGQKLGDAAVAIVEADSLAKDKMIERTTKLLEMDNAEMRTEITIVGMDAKMESGVSVPPITIVNNQPLVVDDATIKTSLEVREHAGNTTKTKVENETTAGANFGFFGQGGSVNTTVRGGVTNERKRTSDYTSTMDVEIHMKQGDVPEGLAIIMDGMMECVKIGQTINQELITRQAQSLAQEVQGVDKLPDAAASGGNS